MSFIYNDLKLLKSLLLAGQESIQKKGQQANPQQLANYVLAKKLAEQLMRQVDPTSVPAAGAPIGTAAGEGVTPSLDRKNLETLGDFLQWAADNQVTWEGKRVAWVLKPGEQAPAGAWKFRTYKIDRERDPYDRSAIEVPAYADKDALVKLISYLRDSQEAKSEKVFSVMLGRLIVQTNQFLEKDEQIAPRPEQKAAETFDANMLVDGFKDSTLNIKDPYAGIQDFMKATDPNLTAVRMTWADISNKAGLIDWLRGMKFIGADGKAYNPTDPGADPCGAVHVLYLRAKYLSQYATDKLRPGFAKLEQAYLKQIQTLGPQFDFNGQACSVTSPSVAVADSDAKSQRPEQAGQQAVNPQALRELSTLRPFDSQSINFSEIVLFLDKYGALANDATVNQQINQVKLSIQEVNNIMPVRSDNFSLVNLTSTKVKTLTRQPVPLMYKLQTIIQVAGDVYKNFALRFRNPLDQMNAYTPVEQQLMVKESNMTPIISVRQTLESNP
jgi:hypothetical protein